MLVLHGDEAIILEALKPLEGAVLVPPMNERSRLARDSSATRATVKR